MRVQDELIASHVVTTRRNDFEIVDVRNEGAVASKFRAGANTVAREPRLQGIDSPSVDHPVELLKVPQHTGKSLPGSALCSTRRDKNAVFRPPSSAQPFHLKRVLVHFHHGIYSGKRFADRSTTSSDTFVSLSFPLRNVNCDFCWVTEVQTREPDRDAATY